MKKALYVWTTTIVATFTMFVGLAVVSSPAHADDDVPEVITKIVYVNVPGATVYVTREVPGATIYLTKTVVETQTVEVPVYKNIEVPVNVENPLNTSLQQKLIAMNKKYATLLKKYKLKNKHELAEYKKKHK